MEPRGGTPEALTDGVTRIRLTAVSVVLTALAFIQVPGLLTADTKFDLALDPGRFLARSVHMWDGSSAFGQLQNQAYGYLWPMGPFFWAGHALDVPAWVVQRGWLALVLVVAFLGVALVARALGVRSDLACVIAGVAFALSPRMLTTLGPISIEAWPSALAPWVLLPLVTGSTRGSPRLAAARSALAVAMVGGVNAAATLTVLPLGVWWLLTRTKGPRRRSLTVWWPVFTVVGTLWWLLPLFLLGSYSPPFLDYIESAANTTVPTTLFDAFRGTSNWVPYVNTASLAGNDLIRQPTLILDSGVLMVLGVAGLLTRGGRPHRFFLVGGLLIGMLLVTAGHLGPVQGWAAPDLQHLLDGALAPLRNVHKFDPIIRLPMVLGLAFFVDSLVTATHGVGPAATGVMSRLNARLLIGTALIAVVGAASPAIAGRIAPADATAGVPDYWRQAAQWLENDESRTTLLVPGSSFGEYVWGSPHDEQFQSLARTPWAVRNAVPLTPPGNIRMLDEVERRLAQGKGSSGLATYLLRAGVSHLLVRNDLSRSPDVPDPVLVHQALANSPGLERVASFGPKVGGDAHLTEDDQRLLINSGWQDEYPALEIYAVDGGTGSGTSTPQAQTSETTPLVIGGPEDLLDLTDIGVLEDQPTELATDANPKSTPDRPVILTDGLRATERNFGRIHDGNSQTLASDDPLRFRKPALDYLPDDASTWSTRAVYTGGRVRASSSLSDANALGAVQPGRMPYAAVDHDPATAWASNFQNQSAPWWQLDLDERRAVVGVAITAGAQDEIVRVRTENEVTEPVDVAAGTTRRISLADEGTSWVRVEDASSRRGRSFSLAEVSVPGVTMTRSLRLPVVPDSWGPPDAVVLRAVDDARTGCAEIDGSVRCVAANAIAGEEPAGFARIVTTPAEQTYTASLRVRARPGDGLLAELLRDQPIGLSASSTGNPDARGSALATVDGDVGTTWTAAMSDLRPELRFNWIEPRLLQGVRVVVNPDAAARAPQTLTLTWPGGSVQVELDKRGRATFAPALTDQLTISVGEAEPVASLDFDSHSQDVPVGISELKLRGVPYEPVVLPQDPVDRPCGSGPTIVVNGVARTTAVDASPAELYAGSTVDAGVCGTGEATLDAGENSVKVLPSNAFAPVSLSLTAGDLDIPQAEPAPGSAVSKARSTYHPATGGVLTLAANTNPGWSAVQDGRRLTPVVVDGWRLGWRLKTDDSVQVTFGPDAVYRGGLVAGGAVLAVFVLWLGLASRRRRSSADAPPLDAAAPPTWALVVLAVAAGGLLGGWLGSGVAVLALGVGMVVSARAPDAGLPVVGALLLPAIVAYALRPWGDPEGWAGSIGWPHYCVLAACIVSLGWSGTGPAASARLFRRIAGRSTSR